MRHTITVRLSSRERSDVELAARLHQMPPATWLRAAAVAASVKKLRAAGVTPAVDDGAVDHAPSTVSQSAASI